MRLFAAALSFLGRFLQPKSGLRLDLQHDTPEADSHQKENVALMSRSADRHTKFWMPCL